jgi:tetratricopeptide (TPR) repeat protein
MKDNATVDSEQCLALLKEVYQNMKNRRESNLATIDRFLLSLHPGKQLVGLGRFDEALIYLEEALKYARSYQPKTPSTDLALAQGLCDLTLIAAEHGHIAFAKECLQEFDRVALNVLQMPSCAYFEKLLKPCRDKVSKQSKPSLVPFEFARERSVEIRTSPKSG